MSTFSKLLNTVIKIGQDILKLKPFRVLLNLNSTQVVDMPNDTTLTPLIFNDASFQTDKDFLEANSSFEIVESKVSGQLLCSISFDYLNEDATCYLHLIKNSMPIRSTEIAIGHNFFSFTNYLVNVNKSDRIGWAFTTSKAGSKFIIMQGHSFFELNKY